MSQAPTPFPGNIPFGVQLSPQTSQNNPSFGSFGTTKLTSDGQLDLASNPNSHSANLASHTSASNMFPSQQSVNNTPKSSQLQHLTPNNHQNWIDANGQFSQAQYSGPIASITSPQANGTINPNPMNTSNKTTNTSTLNPLANPSPFPFSADDLLHNSGLDMPMRSRNNPPPTFHPHFPSNFLHPFGSASPHALQQSNSVSTNNSAQMLSRTSSAVAGNAPTSLGDGSTPSLNFATSQSSFGFDPQQQPSALRSTPLINPIFPSVQQNSGSVPGSKTSVPLPPNSNLLGANGLDAYPPFNVFDPSLTSTFLPSPLPSIAMPDYQQLQKDFTSLQHEYQNLLAVQTDLVKFFVNNFPSQLLPSMYGHDRGLNDDNLNETNSQDDPTGDENSTDPQETCRIRRDNRRSVDLTDEAFHAFILQDTSFTSLFQRVEELSTNYSLQEKLLSQFRASLQEALAKLASNDDNKLNKNIVDRIEKIDSNVSTIQRELRAVERTKDEMLQKLQQQQRDFESASSKRIDDTKAQQTSSYGALEAQIAQLQLKFDRQEEKFKPLMDQNEKQEKIISQLKSNLDRVTSQYTSVHEHHQKQQKDMKLLNQQYQEILRLQKEQQTALTSLQQTCAQYEQQFVDQTKKIKNLALENEQLRSSANRTKSSLQQFQERLDQHQGASKRERERLALVQSSQQQQNHIFNEFISTTKNETRDYRQQQISRQTALDKSVSQLTGTIAHDQSLLIALTKKDHHNNTVLLQRRLATMTLEQVRQLFASGAIVITQSHFQQYLDYIWFASEPETNKIIACLHRSQTSKIKLACLESTYWSENHSSLSSIESTPIEYLLFLLHVYYNVVYEDHNDALFTLFSRVGLPYRDQNHNLAYLYLSHVHLNTHTTYTQHSLNDLIESILSQEPLYSRLLHSCPQLASLRDVSTREHAFINAVNHADSDLSMPQSIVSDPTQPDSYIIGSDLPVEQMTRYSPSTDDPASKALVITSAWRRAPGAALPSNQLSNSTHIQQAEIAACPVLCCSSYLESSWFRVTICIFRFICVLSRSWCTRQDPQCGTDFPNIVHTFIQQMVSKTVQDLTFSELYYLILFWAVKLHQDSKKTNGAVHTQHPVCNSIFDCLDEDDPNVDDIFFFINDPSFLDYTKHAVEWDKYHDRFQAVLDKYHFIHENMSENKKGFMRSGMTKVALHSFSPTLQTRLGFNVAPIPPIVGSSVNASSAETHPVPIATSNTPNPNTALATLTASSVGLSTHMLAEHQQPTANPEALYGEVVMSQLTLPATVSSSSYQDGNTLAPSTIDTSSQHPSASIASPIPAAAASSSSSSSSHKKSSKRRR